MAPPAQDSPGSRPACPACGAGLQQVEGHGGRRYCCPACKGFAMGLAALRPALAQGATTRIWVSSANAVASGRACPFCSRPMRPAVAPPTEAGTAKVEVCRTCEMVWVDAEAAPLLPGPGPQDSAPGGPLAVPVRCDWCGGPYQLTNDGSCRYCGHAVVAPTIVVIPGSISVP